jgi:hypothetical protein
MVDYTVIYDNNYILCYHELALVKFLVHSNVFQRVARFVADVTPLSQRTEIHTEGGVGEKTKDKAKGSGGGVVGGSVLVDAGNGKKLGRRFSFQSVQTEKWQPLLLCAVALVGVSTRVAGRELCPGGSLEALGNAMETTALAGVLTLLPELALPKAPSRATVLGSNSSSSPREQFEPLVLLTLLHALQALCSFGSIDSRLLQAVCGAYRDECFHVASTLLRYCRQRFSEEPARRVLEALLRFLGLFALQNVENQAMFRRGLQTCTLLEQLCNLPFAYYQEPAHRDVLFPTLLAVTFKQADNKALMEQALHSSLLVKFLTARVALAKSQSNNNLPPTDPALAHSSEATTRNTSSIFTTTPRITDPDGIDPRTHGISDMRADSKGSSGEEGKYEKEAAHPSEAIVSSCESEAVCPVAGALSTSTADPDTRAGSSARVLSTEALPRVESIASEEAKQGTGKDVETKEPEGQVNIKTREKRVKKAQTTGRRGSAAIAFWAAEVRKCSNLIQLEHSMGRTFCKFFRIQVFPEHLWGEALAFFEKRDG